MSIFTREIADLKSQLRETRQCFLDLYLMDEKTAVRSHARRGDGPEKNMIVFNDDVWREEDPEAEVLFAARTVLGLEPFTWSAEKFPADDDIRPELSAMKYGADKCP